jgi:hypothetical protein
MPNIGIPELAIIILLILLWIGGFILRVWTSRRR